MKQLTAVIIGAGNRGMTYSKEMYQMPDKFKIVGVAEPMEFRRERAKRRYGIPEENCYHDWETMLGTGKKLADIAIIGTQDNNHYGPAMKALELGYNLLLEKPIAQTEKECTDIARLAHEKGLTVLVCHVLRYTPFFKKLKSVIDSGTIGDVISMNHIEAVGNVHMSHSYVRGDWKSEKESNPMLLAKSCHDIDILQWLVNKTYKKVSSFGKLTYFKPENAPEGAPERCMDGNCPHAETCPYNVMKIYMDPTKWFRYAASRGYVNHDGPTDEEMCDALRHTNFGACVFHAGNDVVDHQVVNLEFSDGTTASFTMNPFNKGGRHIRIFGTKGEIEAYMNQPEFTVYTFEDMKTVTVPVVETDETIQGGHGGGDAGIVNDLYDYMNGIYNGCSIADIGISVANHLVCFAAERARREDTVVDIDKFFDEFHYENKTKFD